MLYLPPLFPSLSVLTFTVPFLLNVIFTIPFPFPHFTESHFVLTITFPLPFCIYYHFTESHFVLTITLLNPILYLPSLFPFLSVVTITSLNPILYLPSLYLTPIYTYHHFTESRFILTITLQFQFSTYRYFSVLYIPSLYRSPVVLMITFRFSFCAYHSAPFAIMYILLLQGG